VSDDYDPEIDPEFTDDTVPVLPDKPMRGYFYKLDEIGDFESAKKFYGRVIKDYSEGAIPVQRARTLGYLLAGYLSYFKQETEQELLTRMAALEKRLDAQTAGGRR